jgi:uridylate kinase
MLEEIKMKKESIKPFIFGLVVGAIVLVIVIFSAGWVMTSGSAQTKAEQIAEDAVIDRLAPICVVQFQQDPEKDQKLKELKEISSYQRGDYVKKQGWATMPGEKEPDSKIADECARRLVELEKK